MKLILTGLFVLFSLYYSVTSRAVGVTVQRPKSSETRAKQAQVSKSLYAKLKAQALNEARAEVAKETEARERAKLEALQELEAGATETEAGAE